MEFRQASFEDELAQHGHFLFWGVGRSMLPLLRAGRDLVLIERPPVDESGRTLRCRKYDVVLYKRGERYILHRVVKVLPDGYVICGDNCWRREYDIGDGQILGVMTAFVRDGHETPVTNRGYQRYTRLWCRLYYARVAIMLPRDILGRVGRKLLRAR